MGNASKQKWLRKIEQARADTTHLLIPAAAPKNALSWCRNVGIASLLLGSVGLMQTFFFPSVIAVYIGLILLIFDLYCEKFTSFDFLRWIIMVVLLAGGATFTKYIVLRQAPLACAFRNADGGIILYVQNDSDDDYLDMDFRLRADYPLDFAVNPKEISHTTGCWFYDPLPMTTTESKDSVMLTADFQNRKMTEPISNVLRVHCDRLGSHASFKITSYFVRQSGRDQIPVETVGKVRLDGTYKAKFRYFDIKTYAATFGEQIEGK